MSTPKYVFFLIYFIFHVLLLGGSIYVMNQIGGSDFTWINGFVNGKNVLFTQNNVIYFAILGLILFGINVAMVNWQIRNSRRKITKQENEINSLKAKIYDLQGTPASPTPRPASKSTPQDSDHPESKNL